MPWKRGVGGRKAEAFVVIGLDGQGVGIQSNRWSAAISVDLTACTRRASRAQRPRCRACTTWRLRKPVDRVDDPPVVVRCGRDDGPESDDRIHAKGVAPGLGQGLREAA